MDYSCRDDLRELARRIHNILDGMVRIENDAILFDKMRDLDIRIQGVMTHSPAVLDLTASFEPAHPRSNGPNDDFLVVAEAPVLGHEVNPIISAGRRNNLEVTAVHNHWIFTQPDLWYVHFQKVGNPITVAHELADTFAVLHDRG